LKNLTFYLRKVGTPDFFDPRPFELKPHIRSALKFWTKKMATFSSNHLIQNRILGGLCGDLKLV